MFNNFRNPDSYVAFVDAPTIDEEVKDQEQEVLHFRNIEHLPEERNYE